MRFLLRALALSAAAVLCGAALSLASPYHVEGTLSRATGFLTWEETLPPARRTALPPLETGDILVTMSTYTLGLHYGHCALVVDGPGGVVLEAVAPGSPSRLTTAEGWARYATLWLLRPADLTEAEQAKLAEEAADLTGLPYALFPLQEEPTGVCCSSLVLYAYRGAGRDIPCAIPGLCTPYDLLRAPVFRVLRLQ